MRSKIIKNFFYKKKVLITGHTGFSGAWITYILNYFGAYTYGLSLSEKNKNSFYNALDIKKKIKGEKLIDIRNKILTKKYINKISPEIIFHLAAQPLVSEAYKNTSYTFETNVIGTINLLEACKKLKKLKSIIVVTSDKCYKNFSIKKKIFKESDQLGANDPYSTSKAAQELVVDTYREYILKNQNFLISTARAGNIIGGGDFAKDRIVPDFFRSLKTKNKLLIRNSNATRPWQFILDVVFGYLTLALKHKKNNQGSWNFGPNKNNFNVEKLINSLNSFNQYKVKIIKQKNKIKESQYLALDSSKSKRRLGWKPVYNVHEGLKLTSEWYNCINQKKKLMFITKKQLQDYLKKIN